MGSTIVEQDFPVDISHRGEKDRLRHNKRVDEAARKQIKDLISSQDIITSEGNKRVKVRLKYLDQYRFVHSRDRADNIGRDQFDDLSADEVLYRPNINGQGEGPGDQVGNGPGSELYEAEYTIEELTDMMIKELKLPDLDEMKKNEIISDVLEWTDRRKESGIQALIDKKQTMLAHIKRKSIQGVPPGEKRPILKEDLRFRTWNVAQERHSNAVVFLMMDRSGSMYEEKIYAAKALFFWTVQFLKRKYDRVEVRFIAHDSVARELKEKEFFTISDDGGTMVSSAYELCRDMIKHNYPSDVWNTYCFHASDGDSFGDENYCMKLVSEMINDLGAIMFAYAEIAIKNWSGDRPSNLLNHFKKHMQKQDGIVTSVIKGLGDIPDALQAYFRGSLRRITDSK